ncbi:uncharacterized protein LOC113509109 [Galleria mellonella]|uniref:Uncharacterized protein LOC113509109 n=1 Tax=Galleria mellonella TaxID=7137 RepID=A0A6J1W730_GALME|nr:uncharacterized protein LOC113509109 [Galleria mellonella]
MLRVIRNICIQRKIFLTTYVQTKNFLTNEYKCLDAWNKQISSSLLNRINLTDFYNTLDQHVSSKGIISALDVDIFANAIKDPNYLEELKDLLLKLRLSSETGNMLESTHHATIRNFIQYERIQELIEILKDPLNFGLFLDDFTANILLDKLITSSNYEQAANVAALVMLQEEYNNDITCALCQYACYKYIIDYIKPEIIEPVVEKPKKVEEIKIRVKYLRNPYFDDHFDLKDLYTLSGKTLAWISEKTVTNLNKNLQLIGWLTYKKYNKLETLCNNIVQDNSSKIYPEVIELLKRESNNVEEQSKLILENCILALKNVKLSEASLEESLKTHIENAINKVQNKDIANQQKLFKLWEEVRQEKLEDQTKRLDRAKRLQLIQEKEVKMKEEEQKLWFFENQDSIDLEIEEKENLTEASSTKNETSKSSDNNYIPPEILPKRK